MGSGNAPDYAEAKNYAGPFGGSISNESGTYYMAPAWINNTMGKVSGKLNTAIDDLDSGYGDLKLSLDRLKSNDYLNDPNFKVYKNNFDKLAQQSYDTSVLGTLADRNLMRSSGLEALTNNWTTNMQDNLTDLMDNYYNRLANNYGLELNANQLKGNNLANLLNVSNALYGYVTGVNNGAANQANNVSNYNLGAWNAQNQANSNLWGSLAQAGGTVLGSALGGPVGGAVGSQVGSFAKNLFK